MRKTRVQFPAAEQFLSSLWHITANNLSTLRSLQALSPVILLVDGRVALQHFVANTKRPPPSPKNSQLRHYYNRCIDKFIDPGRTRTCNPRLRRPMPYPLGHGPNCILQKRATGCTRLIRHELSLMVGLCSTPKRAIFTSRKLLWSHGFGGSLTS